jgi:serine/threonine protein kinase
MMDQYVVGHALSEEAFGSVHKVLHKADGKSYIMKIFDKHNMDFDEEIDLNNQVELLKSIKHDNILNIHECYSEMYHYHVIYDLAEGGDLFERLMKRVGKLNTLDDGLIRIHRNTTQRRKPRLYSRT